MGISYRIACDENMLPRPDVMAFTAGISPCFVKKYQKTSNEKILYFTKINAGKHIIFSFQ